VSGEWGRESWAECADCRDFSKRLDSADAEIGRLKRLQIVTVDAEDRAACASALAEIKQLRTKLAEFEQHERQTHETLGAILGTDTSLEAGAKRLFEQKALLLSACKIVAEMAVAWQPLTPGDIAEVNAAILKAEGK